MLDDATIARFWAKVDKDGPIPDPAIYGDIGACWVWTGALLQQRADGPRYGRFSISKHVWRYAHHVAMESAGVDVSVLSRRTVAMHRCDNRSCCNPAHLTIGTQSQNVADGFRRNGRVSTSGPGERGPRAILTWDKVRQIRSSTETGRVLAARFGVSPRSILAIRKGETWIGDGPT